MFNVRTKFDRVRTHTPAGTRYLNVYQEEISKSGRKHLVKTGETCVYDRIQADLESSKIETILHQVAMGDLSVLNQRETMYVDATNMPKNLMEAQNIVIKAKAEFEQFPKEVREIFHNSPEEYVSEMGTQEFLNKMSPYNKKLAAINEAGSLEEYNKKVAAQAKFESDVAAAKGAAE